MARPLRIEFPGAVYHVTSRGNAKQKIYFDDVDRYGFLKLLCETVERFNLILHSYCLMNNHYHLLIETPEGNLSKAMRQLNGVYTQKFNRRHNRVGHLFQGRYKAILIDKHNYLLELCRYIVLNPVRKNLTKKPENWHWSSFRATALLDKKIPCLHIDWILSQFDRKRREAARKYKYFVYAKLNAAFPWEKLTSQIILGEKDFVEKLKCLLKEKRELKEIPRVQRYLDRPSLENLFEESLFSKTMRDEKIYVAYTKYGYTLKEIAGFLGLHYATASRAIKRLEEKKKM
jgi:REP element-mobilizing transposase RayT